MKRKFEEFMYGLCWRGDWIADVVSRVWFRWYCPYPVHRNWTAKCCIESGDCGCDNKNR